MLRAALTKIRMTGLLKTLEEIFVRVPAVATRIAASPGAQLLSTRALLALANVRVTSATATKTCRSVDLFDA